MILCAVTGDRIKACLIQQEWMNWAYRTLPRVHEFILSAVAFCVFLCLMWECIIGKTALIFGRKTAASDSLPCLFPSWSLSSLPLWERGIKTIRSTLHCPKRKEGYRISRRKSCYRHDREHPNYQCLVSSKTRRKNHTVVLILYSKWYLYLFFFFFLEVRPTKSDANKRNVCSGSNVW